ncbi:MAG: S-adenosyl-L-methionine-dependent methyltransferase [Monoraphidium minutum]|nr:MAG: S-adenosyl-L-methionine-dependent methyltransferase [Monoraphidium minutum]
MPHGSYTVSANPIDGGVRSDPAGRAGGGRPKFSASHQSEGSVDLFQQEWELYQRVIEYDYLRHAGTHAAVEALLRRLSAARAAAAGAADTSAAAAAAPGLKVLDLGCGDAHCVSAALAAAAGGGGAGGGVASYTGVDMSAPALEVAAANLRCALGGGGGDGGARIRLVQGDMLAFARECRGGGGGAFDQGVGFDQDVDQPFDRRFDVVYAALSAHHLDADQKRELLRLVGGGSGGGLLAPGGVLILVDVFTGEGESRDAYMSRFRADVAANWPRLSPRERQSILDHATGFDHPWDPAALRRWAAEPAGAAAAAGVAAHSEGAAGESGSDAEAAAAALFPGGAVVAYEQKFYKTVWMQAAGGAALV